jgi:hypothetical protein
MTPPIPSNLRSDALEGSTDFKKIRTLVPHCPQEACMTYTQGMGNLWIKKPFCSALKTIHRFPPSPRALYTGGFRLINPFKNKQIMHFSTKSGSTITTML